MTRRIKNKFKYLNNEQSFSDEIKGIFHYFQRAFIEVNKESFLEGESPILNNDIVNFHVLLIISRFS